MEEIFLSLHEDLDVLDKAQVASRTQVEGRDTLELLKYVQRTFSNLGLPLPPIELAGATFSAPVLDSFCALLQLSQNNAELARHKASLVAELQFENAQLTNEKNRLSDKLNKTEKDLNFARTQERVQKETLAAEKTKWSLERQELRKQLGALQQKDTQYQHEIRKKEREYERLKEKLRQFIAEKKKEGRSGTDALKPFNCAAIAPLSNASPNTLFPAKRSDEDIFHGIVSSYEKKLAMLRDEVDSLRHCLLDAHVQLHLLASSAPKPPGKSEEAGEADGGSQEAAETHINELLEEVGGLPCHLFCKTVKQRIGRDIHLLRAKGQHPPPPPPVPAVSASYHNDVQLLRAQLLEQQAIIKEQDELLSLATSSSAAATKALDDSAISEVKDALALERKLVEDQKQHLEEERQRVTLAAIELGNDRLRLEHERRALMRERGHEARTSLNNSNKENVSEPFEWAGDLSQEIIRRTNALAAEASWDDLALWTEQHHSSTLPSPIPTAKKSET
jgi:X breakpoint 2-interacting protein